MYKRQVQSVRQPVSKIRVNNDCRVVLLLTRNSQIVIDKALRFDVSFVKKEEKTSIRSRKKEKTSIRS